MRSNRIVIIGVAPVSIIFYLYIYLAQFSFCSDDIVKSIKLIASIKPGTVQVGVPIAIDVTIHNTGPYEVIMPNVESARHWAITAKVTSCPNINNETISPRRYSRTLANVHEKEVVNLIRLIPDEKKTVKINDYYPLLPGKHALTISLHNDSLHVDNNPHKAVIPGLWHGTSSCYVNIEIPNDINNAKKTQLDSDYKIILTSEDLTRIKGVLSKYNKYDDYYSAEMLIKAYRNTNDNINKKILVANTLLDYIRSGVAYDFVSEAIEVLENGNYPLDLRRGILQCTRDYYYDKDTIGLFVLDIAFYELVGDIKRKFINTIDSISRNGSDPDMAMVAADIKNKMQCAKQ